MIFRVPAGSESKHCFLYRDFDGDGFFDSREERRGQGEERMEVLLGDAWRRVETWDNSAGPLEVVLAEPFEGSRKHVYRKGDWTAGE